MEILKQISLVILVGAISFALIYGFVVLCINFIIIPEIILALVIFFILGAIVLFSFDPESWRD